MQRPDWEEVETCGYFTNGLWVDSPDNLILTDSGHTSLNAMLILILFSHIKFI